MYYLCLLGEINNDLMEEGEEMRQSTVERKKDSASSLQFVVHLFVNTIQNQYQIQSFV